MLGKGFQWNYLPDACIVVFSEFWESAFVLCFASGFEKIPSLDTELITLSMSVW